MDRNKEIDLRAKMTAEYYSQQCFCTSEEELLYAMRCILNASIEALSRIQGWEQTAEMLEEIRSVVIKNKDNYACDVERPETEH